MWTDRAATRSETGDCWRSLAEVGPDRMCQGDGFLGAFLTCMSVQSLKHPLNYNLLDTNTLLLSRSCRPAPSLTARHQSAAILLLPRPLQGRVGISPPTIQLPESRPSVSHDLRSALSSAVDSLASQQVDQSTSETTHNHNVSQSRCSGSRAACTRHCRKCA
jgi:hypothetical protein